MIFCSVTKTYRQMTYSIEDLESFYIYDKEVAACVEAWENTPRPFDDPYSDMNTEEKSKLLVYLQQTIDNLNNTVESLREELRQSREQKEKLLRDQADLRSALKDLSQSLLSAEAAQKKADSVIDKQARQISDLQDQLKRNNKAQFGRKSKKKPGNDEPPMKRARISLTSHRAVPLFRLA